MSDNKTNYGELFCEAVDTIIKERLTNISFDTTILCEVEEIIDKDKGRYLVSYTNTKFEAHSLNENKYAVGNQVYVEIPNGDWNERKFIKAKKTEDETIPVNYQYPFDRYVDITGNILSVPVSGMLMANDSDAEETSTLLATHTVFDGSLNNFTRLGIQAGFRSWLAEDDVAFGSYGLKVRAFTNDDVAYDFILDAKDMIGNPYAFDTYFHQEKLFNISDLTSFQKMEIYFYQNGDFKKYNVDSSDDENKFISIESPDYNLFVNDIYISFGYDIEEIDTNSVVLHSPDPLTYTSTAKDPAKNKRRISVRWFYRDNNGVHVVNNASDSEVDYTITWYRYKLGAYSDIPFSGIDWEAVARQTVKKEVNGAEIIKNISYNKIDPDNTFIDELYFNSCIINPDVTKANERIKVVISYKDADGNEIQKQSQVFTLTNEQEVVSDLTIEALSALTIECEDGSNGNYLIYSLGGKILDNAAAAQTRVLTPYLRGEKITNAESVKWTVPTRSSMLRVDGVDDQGIKIYDGGTNWIIEDNGILKYQIKNFTQSPTNNIIQCEVVVNKVKYIAVKEFTFGPAGTSGSNYTLHLDFKENNVNAIPVGEVDKTFEVIARLYDFTGKEVQDFDNETFPITWELTGYQVVEPKPSDDDKVAEPIAASGLTIDETTEAVNTLTVGENINIDQLYILSASIDQTIGKGETRTLTAYLPIPLYKYQTDSTIQYSHIQGATQVIYLSNGQPEYTKLPYILYNNQWGEIQNTTAKIAHTSNDTHYVPEIRNNTLCPVSMYIEGSDPYGVQILGKGGEVLWTQPILTLLNRYPNAAVNEWDGKTLTIDDSKGQILATAIAAGKKEKWSEDKISYSAFTGVMLGDWQEDSDKSLTLTGLYGFHRGQQCFAFKEDGKAFIGKSGKGRILFDGEKGTIESSLWQKGQGLQIDIDDGFLKMQMPAGYNPVPNLTQEDFNKDKSKYYIYEEYRATNTWDATAEYYKKTDAGNYVLAVGLTEDDFKKGTYYLYINEYRKAADEWDGNQTYYIKDDRNKFISLDTGAERYPLAIGSAESVNDRKFKVDWDGTVYIRDGEFAGHIDASSGSIGGWWIGSDLSAGSTILHGDGIIETEYLKIGYKYPGQWYNTEIGQLGYIEGSDGTNKTINVGLKSVKGSNVGVRIESDRDIAIETKGDSKSGGIYLKAGENEGGQVSISGYSLVVNIDADKQTGIYARFA